MHESSEPQPADRAPALPSGGMMDVEELTDFIAAFNESTARLRESHERLRGRADELANELSKKNRELTARVEEVSALKNYLANILESISDGVLTIDLDRRLVALNEAAVRLLPDAVDWREEPDGIFPARAASEEAPPARKGEVRGAVAEILVRAMEEERAIANVEVEVKGGDGAPRSLSVSAAPIRNAAGALLGAVATFRDNTEIRRLERILRRRDRLAALGEMTAQLAHEIRNPLGGIELYASLLDRALEALPEERELACKIGRATSSLNRLVEDMLTFTRPVQPERVRVGIEQLLEGALDLAGAALSEASVEVRRHYAPESCAMVDPDLVQRAFLNVILNAAQHMPGGGRLDVSTHADDREDARGPRLQVRIADTGPGVPEAVRDKIFNPFFTEREKGTGLGLAIVHKIIQEHEGSVSVESNAPRGAVFVFDFPLAGGARG